MSGSRSDRLPKILHIITRLDPGGSATNTLVSAEGLRKKGFETALAYGPTADPGGSVERYIREHSLESFFIPDLVWNIAPFRDIKAGRALSSLLAEGSFDLVHTHTSKAGVLGRLAAHRRGLPVVHTPHGHIFYGYFGAALTRFFVLIEQGLAPWTDRIVSLTDDETREALARNIGKPEQYVTIPSGVPIERFRAVQRGEGTFRKDQRIEPDDFLFISVGRLTHIKGFDILLQAFARARFERRVKLVLVGEGEERANLEQQVRDLNLSGPVRLAGELKDVTPALAAADAFALASRNEGMGRVFIEAMAAGLPVIGPRTGGVPTIIRHDQNGLLAECGDPESLARTLERLAADPALCRRLGDQAVSSVYPEFDEDTMLERLAGVYVEVLKRRNKSQECWSNGEMEQ
ncbi:MAG: glycosyltransferase [Lentisphaerota bacterium]